MHTVLPNWFHFILTRGEIRFDGWASHMRPRIRAIRRLGVVPFGLSRRRGLSVDPAMLFPTGGTNDHPDQHNWRVFYPVFNIRSQFLARPDAGFLGRNTGRRM